MGDFGIVIIGRNEGDRLDRCLKSLAPWAGRSVYVDSGSTDGSTARARAAGFDVVELDPSAPFTAGRARNAGLERLLQGRPELELVQFVDGDCELEGGWLDTALRELALRPKAALVAGRRHERFPDASPYNRLCDMEWDTPVGPAEALGGDALVRVAALRRVGGFSPVLIAGEDTDLHVRLRRAGWTIERIAAEMTIHDAAMLRFSQWWRRTVRSGIGMAQAALGHDRDVLAQDVHDLRSVAVYAVAIPALAAALAWPTYGASLMLTGIYWVLYRRIRGHRLAAGAAPEHAAIYARYCVLGKFAQAWGAACAVWRRLSGRNRTRLVEYKGAAPVARPAA